MICSYVNKLVYHLIFWDISRCASYPSFDSFLFVIVLLQLKDTIFSVRNNLFLYSSKRALSILVTLHVNIHVTGFNLFSIILYGKGFCQFYFGVVFCHSLIVLLGSIALCVHIRQIIQSTSYTEVPTNMKTRNEDKDTNQKYIKDQRERFARISSTNGKAPLVKQHYRFYASSLFKEKMFEQMKRMNKSSKNEGIGCSTSSMITHLNWISGFLVFDEGIVFQQYCRPPYLIS